MASVWSPAIALLVGLCAAACGSAPSETITGTTLDRDSGATTVSASTTPGPPATVAYAPDGDTIFITHCEAVQTFLLTPFDERDLGNLTKVFQRLKPVVAVDNADLAADLDWIGEIIGADEMSEADEAEAIEILLPIDRGTYELCGVPILSAFNHVSIQRFCRVQDEIDNDRPAEAPAIQAEEPEPEERPEPDCGPIWATSLPCFESIEARDEPWQFEYRPTDCETGDEVELNEDGEWETPIIAAPSEPMFVPVPEVIN